MKSLSRSLLMIAAGLIAIGWLAVRWNGATLVESDLVTKRAIREFVEEEGKTRLAETYLISMPFEGRVESIELTEGMRVTKGQVLARIVQLDLDLNVAAAQAAVDRLKASIRENDDTSVEYTGLEQARNYVDSMNRTVEAAAARVKSGEAKKNYAAKNLGRVRDLNAQNVRTDDELEKAEVTDVESTVNYQQDVLVHRAVESMRAATALLPTAVRQYIARKGLSSKVLEKQLVEAEVQLQQMNKDLGRGVMTSPNDGVVLARLVGNERQLAAGAELLRLGRYEDLEIESDILSQEVVRVKEDQVAEISGPAIGRQLVHARVSRIYPAGFTKVSSLGVEQQRVKVVLQFNPEDLDTLRTERNLGSDYRVRVRIITAEKTAALVIPRSALFRSPAGEWQVYAIRDDRAVLQDVELGLSNDDEAEIVAGLETDERVVLAPETNLANGQRVEAKP